MLKLKPITVIIALSAAVAVAIGSSLLFVSLLYEDAGGVPNSSTSFSSAPPSLLRSGKEYHNIHHHNRQLSILGTSNTDLMKFKDPKSIMVRNGDGGDSVAPFGEMEGIVETDAAASSSSDTSNSNNIDTLLAANRKNCQIIYILGVEGATHHGFLPIIETLANSQIDDSGEEYVVDNDPIALKLGLFGWYRTHFLPKWIAGWGRKKDDAPGVDDKELVRHVIEESCPLDKKRHVLIEWASFPSGQEYDHRSYRVHRQHSWLSSTPLEISQSESALNHPTNLYQFYDAYAPYAEIKFIVLHRPYLNTIASHSHWDESPEIHSNVLRGFMLLLRNFLDAHAYDVVSGDKLWSLVCVERIFSTYYSTERQVKEARARVVAELAKFMGWPKGECEHCFDDWYESKKDPVAVLGEEMTNVMLDHMRSMEGVWPPIREDDVLEEQKCGI